MKKLTILFAIICLSLNVFAQTTDKPVVKKVTPKGININGLRIFGLGFMIFQLDDKDFNSETPSVGNSILKFRLGAEYEFLKNMFFHAEFQDSRMMYHDETVVGQTDHYFELFQGYIELKKLFGTDFGIKAGRFQMGYGTGKYLGKSFWHINERRFEGVKLQYQKKTFVADLFYTRHQSVTPYMLKTLRKLYPLNPGPNYGNDVFGLWTKTSFNKNHKLDLFAFREAKYSDKLDMKRNTAGLNYNGKMGAFSFLIEFAYQFGTSKANAVVKDINANHAGLKLNYKMKPVKLTAGFDMFSGTAPGTTGEINTFSNELGGKHKFLGLMDYFLAIPHGTGNLGVNDYYFGIAFPNMCKGFTTSLMGHLFMANQKSAGDLSDFGKEIDLVFSYKFAKKLILKGGASMFSQGDLMKHLWTVGNIERTDASFWSFIMLVVKI